MRACRAAGFDGFQDLKYHVLRELTGGVLQEAPASQANYRDDLRASLGAAETAVEAAAQLIRGAQRVALTGVGASHGVALIATDILFTLGKQALPIQSEQDGQLRLHAPRERTGGAGYLAFGRNPVPGAGRPAGAGGGREVHRVDQ